MFLSSSSFLTLTPLFPLLRLQVNFVVCQLCALISAFWFRLFLHPSKTSPFIRHVVATVLGLYFALFCFGWWGDGWKTFLVPSFNLFLPNWSMCCSGKNKFQDHLEVKNGEKRLKSWQNKFIFPDELGQLGAVCTESNIDSSNLVIWPNHPKKMFS